MALTLTLIAGAATFRDISHESGVRFEQRTPALYIANRFRGIDAVQIVSIGDGTPALKIGAPENGSGFDIYIYLHNGYIHEMYDLGFDEVLRPDAGIELFAVSSLSFDTIFDNLLVVDVNGTLVYVNTEVGQ
jgi:hypothetical protein